ncbi:MAG: DNA polymerase III subunit gamma/tau, partial [Pseudonocardiaceae bacterium]
LVFLFATTEPEKVLATIRSRTHHYPFRLLPPSTMRGLLEQVCADEAVQVEPAVYPLVIRAGGGSARDSLSVLDQLLAGAGPDGITYARAVTLLGVTDAALIDDMVSALAAQDGGAVFTTIDRLVEAGHDPRRFASDLLQRLRDLVLLRVAPDAAGHGLVDAPDDQLRAMTEQAERLGAGSLTRFAEIVHTGLTEMRGATAPRLLLELLCARMLLPAAAEGDGAVLHRLERLERRLTIAPPDDTAPAPVRSAEPAPPASMSPAGRAEPQPAPRTGAQPAPRTGAQPAQRPAAQAQPAPHAQPAQRPEPARPPAPPEPRPDAEPPDAQTPPEPPAPGQLDAAAVRRVWQALLDAVREHSRATQVLLSNATASAVQGDTLVLTLPTAPLARRLADERNVEMIKGALRAVLGVDWQIRCEHAGGDPAPRGATRPSPQPQRPRPAQRPPEGAASAPGLRSPAPSRPATQDDGIPLPPEPPEFSDPPEPDGPGPRRHAVSPPPPPVTEDDEEAMLAEAAADAHRESGSRMPVSPEPLSRRDPEDAALELLTEQLGARRLDP